VITCRIRAPADAVLSAALNASDSLSGAHRQHRGVTAIPAAGWRISGQEPRKGAIMAAGTTSRAEHCSRR
jgi:hypothetical protein